MNVKVYVIEAVVYGSGYTDREYPAAYFDKEEAEKHRRTFADAAKGAGVYNEEFNVFEVVLSIPGLEASEDQS